MSKTVAQFVCLLVSLSFAAFGQNTAGTASISGSVVDASGAAVPGAKVIVANESKAIRRELETTESGVFNAAALVPAAGYTITVSKSGFADYQVKEVTLNVGQTLNLSPTLSVTAAATQVNVTTEAPIVDSAKTDVSGLVDSHQIMDLPINGRRVDNFVLLQPAVTSDAAFGLLTFRGLAGGNSFLTDGIDTTNSYYDENAGRTRTYNISQDAVQEFQVVSSGYLAEYGKASGGVVNTITRSGTNEYHGTAYWFFRNRTLNATDISSNGVNPQDWRHQAGASVGGPIKKDKLFFFFNGELQRRFFPIVSSNNTQNKLLFPTPSAITPASLAPGAVCGPTKINGSAQAFTPTLAQCNTALTYIASRALTQLVPRTADVNLMFGKVDYQLNDRNRASFEVNYLDFRSPNGIQTQLSLTNGAALGNNANTTVFDRTAKAGLTTIVSANSVNELKFGYFKDRQYDPNSPSLLPTINGQLSPIGLSVSGAYGISNIGYATGYNRLNPSEQRFQVADTYSYTVGKHNLKFGFDYDNTEDYVNNLTNRYPSYTYGSITALALDFSGNTTGTKFYNSYTQRFGNPIVDIFVNNFAAFLQDEVKVTPKLTITPGLRWETSVIPQPVDIYPALINGNLPQTKNIPQTRMNFMPRFGLAYAFNQKTVFRANYGIFDNRYPSSSIANFITNNGVYQASYTINGTNAQQLAAGPVFAGLLTQQPSNVPGVATPAYADRAFRNSYSQQSDAAIERQLSKDSSITVSYIWSRALHLISAYDANVAAPTSSYTYQILDAGNNPVGSYTTPLYTQRLNNSFGQVTAVTSSANSYYNGMTVQYNKRYFSWFQGQVSYTYSHAIDYNIGGGGNTLFTPSSPTSYFNGNYSGEKGSSSTDQRHRMAANFIVSPRFTTSSSWAARYLINNWQLSGLTTAASAQPLVPTVTVSGGPAGRLVSGSLNGLGGSGRVPFESISALDADQLYRTDARLSKILPITERFKVTLMFEAFNVFNHHFYAGTTPRVATQYSTVQLPGANNFALAPFPTYGLYSTSSAPLEGTTARRAQAALRIEF